LSWILNSKKRRTVLKQKLRMAKSDRQKKQKEREEVVLKKGWRQED